MAAAHSTTSKLFDTDPVSLRCSRCKLEKPIDDFDRRPNRSENGKRRGRNSHCKQCLEVYRTSPRGRELQNSRMTAFRTRLRENNLPELRKRERKGNLHRLYKMSIEDYEAMVVAQDGKCAICGELAAGGRWKRRLHVDHDHATGTIRELLCHGCNVAIGSFRENPDLLLKTIEYLKKHGRK